MKTVKYFITGSLTIALLTFNVNANENIIDTAEVNQQLEVSLSNSLSDIALPETQEIIAKQLEQARLELQIGQLVAQAGDELPSGFKVVLAD